jgi:hypothetical protein
MSVWQKVKVEIRLVLLTTLYFAFWLGMLMLLKELVLAEYQIAFHGFSLALLGALVLAKVVLILDHVPLGARIGALPAWVDVTMRTALYSLGVAVVLLIEMAFEGRHEHGGFGASLRSVFDHPELPHVWATTIVLGGALLAYNCLRVFNRHLGKGGLARLLRSPLPAHDQEATTR